MSKVAGSLRHDTARAEAALPLEDRILRVLALGDSDVQLHASANGVTLDEARAALKRQRTMGRRPSRCASEP